MRLRIIFCEIKADNIVFDLLRLYFHFIHYFWVSTYTRNNISSIYRDNRDLSSSDNHKLTGGYISCSEMSKGFMSYQHLVVQIRYLILSISFISINHHHPPLLSFTNTHVFVPHYYKYGDIISHLLSQFSLRVDSVIYVLI